MRIFDSSNIQSLLDGNSLEKKEMSLLMADWAAVID